MSSPHRGLQSGGGVAADTPAMLEFMANSTLSQDKKLGCSE